MKDNFSLRIFCLFLIIFSAISKKNIAPKDVFRHYYFLQKLYPGTDSITSFVSLKQNMKLYFFTLNKRMLFYSNNALDKKIEGNLLN